MAKNNDVVVVFLLVMRGGMEGERSSCGITHAVVVLCKTSMAARRNRPFLHDDHAIVLMVVLVVVVTKDASPSWFVG